MDTQGLSFESSFNSIGRGRLREQKRTHENKLARRARPSSRTGKAHSLLLVLFLASTPDRELPPPNLDFQVGCGEVWNGHFKFPTIPDGANGCRWKSLRKTPTLMHELIEEPIDLICDCREPGHKRALPSQPPAGNVQAVGEDIRRLFLHFAGELSVRISGSLEGKRCARSDAWYFTERDRVR